MAKSKVAEQKNEPISVPIQIQQVNEAVEVQDWIKVAKIGIDTESEKVAMRAAAALVGAKQWRLAVYLGLCVESDRTRGYIDDQVQAHKNEIGHN